MGTRGFVRSGAAFLKQLQVFSAPLSATFLAMAGVGYYLTFVSLHFTHLGYDVRTIGVIQATYFLGLLVGAWNVEALVRRVGHIQVLAAAGSVFAATILCQALTNNISLWLVTRFLAGMSLAAFYVVVECWMLDRIDGNQRGALLALYMVALNAGYALGQQLFLIIPIVGLKPFIVGALMGCISVVPVALSTRRLSMPDETGSLNMKRMILISPFGALGCLASGLCISALYSFLAVTGNLAGVTGAQLVFILVIGGLVAQWPLGRLSDFLDRRLVLLAICVVLSLTCVLLIPHHAQQAETTLLLVACLGGLVYAIYPISLTQVADRLSMAHLTAATANLLFLYGVGSVCGPILASFVVSSGVAGGLYIYVLSISVALIAAGCYSLWFRKPVPEDDQAEFVLVSRTTPIAIDLDPRTESEE